MNWLLKITEGPMKGAEIALVGGSRVTFGRGDRCDVVIADAALAEEAFSLDVSDAAVTLVTPDGSTLPMNAFETRLFGATELAIGPADGAWEALRPAAAPSEAAPEAPSETPPAEPAASAPATPSAEPAPAGRSWTRIGVLAGIILLALLVLWWIVAAVLKDAPRTRAATVADDVKIRELAQANGLDFAVSNGVMRLKGNLAHRTERLAVRALALSANRYCHLDLSDDESFLKSAEALLFTVTEGAIKALVATNRALSVTGYAPDARALVRVEEALKKDVPWLAVTHTGAVRVGGAMPPELVGNFFARTGQLANRTEGTHASALATEAEGNAGTATESEMDAGTAAEATVSTNGFGRVVAAAPGVTLTPEDLQALALVRAARLTAGKLPRGILPVAGILTKPYPCVVLQGGQRLVEGAKVQGLEIRRIASTRVTFGFRKENVYWEP